MDQHQQTSRHPKSSLTSETSHWTLSSLDSVPLQSSSRPWFPNEMQNVLLSEKRTLDLWETVQVFFSLNQIKSNHFYCHITTAQVPWWVKFLWACYRQCRKTTDNLPMDRQCKKTTNNLHMDRQCKKLHWSIYSAPDSAKKQQQQFTYGQTVQKSNSNLHMDSTYYRLYRRQCAKYTYIYSVHIVYYKDILNYQRHIIHRMGTSALCTVSIHNVVYA